MAAESGTAHSEATLALAKKESAEHMHGMQELYDDMRKRPLIVKAYALDDPKAPDDAMVVHFVRHGQGFHNLMADIASSEGREWVQVSLPCVLAGDCVSFPKSDHEMASSFFYNKILSFLKQKRIRISCQKF